MRVLVFSFAVLLTACNAETDATHQDKLLANKVSYGIGYRVGVDMKRGEMNIDRNTLIQGIEDALDGKSSRFAPEEIQSAVTEYRQQRLQARLKLAAANEAAGQRFLSEYKKKKNVLETPSGIQYRIVEEGKGKQPKTTDTVRVQYQGRLINGKEFDSTNKLSVPMSMRVNRTLPGWQEILPLMHEGGKWEVVIPSRLAYSLRGVPPSIGPNETLIFELNLIDVVKPQVDVTTTKSAL